MSAVTREDFISWNTSPVTKRLKDQIKKDIDNMYEILLHSELDEVKELQGRIKASKNLIDVEYEDLYE